MVLIAATACHESTARLADGQNSEIRLYEGVEQLVRRGEERTAAKLLKRLASTPPTVMYYGEDGSPSDAPTPFVPPHVDLNRLLKYDSRAEEQDRSDFHGSGQTSLLPPPPIVKRVPRGVALVHFKMRANRLAVGVTIDDEFLPIEVDVPRSELTSISKQWVRLLQEGSDPQKQDAYADLLYSLLLRPFEGLLDGIAVLAVVPDRFLRKVPFAALKDRRGLPLPKKLAVVVLPGVARLFWPFERADLNIENLGRDDFEHVFLGLADSEVGLEPLPAARNEIRSAAENYESATLFSGGRATKSALCESAKRSTVIHVATHTEIVVHAPFVSRLLLAPELAESGDLPAHALEGCDLSGAHLVILAGCETAIWDPRRTRSFAFVDPLHRQGVSAVVASLWPIEDHDSAAFLRIFHNQLPDTHPVRALRVAQRALLSDPHSQAWFSYQLFVRTLPVLDAQ